MDQKIVNIVAITAAAIAFILLLVVGGMSYKLSGFNKQKEAEIKRELEAQKNELEESCQLDKEKTLTTYIADEVFGSFEFSYPKVWSTHVVQTVGQAEELVFLADPKQIAIKDKIETTFTGLRVKVFKSGYNTIKEDFDRKYIEDEEATFSVSDITVSSLSGKKYVGTDPETEQKISFIILPLRDKTLYIGTDDIDRYINQFTKIADSFRISR